jgi:hypothetical protein
MNRFSKVVFFGQNQEFQAATKEEQERIILCRSIIQKELSVFIRFTFKSGATRRNNINRQKLNCTYLEAYHIGEYDFTNLLNIKNLRFDMEKSKALDYQKSLEKNQNIDNQ